MFSVLQVGLNCIFEHIVPDSGALRRGVLGPGNVCGVVQLENFSSLSKRQEYF